MSYEIRTKGVEMGIGWGGGGFELGLGFGLWGEGLISQNSSFHTINIENLFYGSF